MSTLKVDTLTTRDGQSSLTLGASGKTLTIPSGATITNSGTATGFGESNTPYFDVKTSGDQTLNHNTVTKISFNTELQDSANAFDSSTNYRFTPQTAGRYLIYASLSYYNSGTILSDARTYIYKNGSALHESELNTTDGATSRLSATAISIVDMNGSSDFIQGYVVGNVVSGTPQLKSDSNKKTRFGAFRIIT